MKGKNARTIITFYYYLEAQPTTFKVSMGERLILKKSMPTFIVMKQVKLLLILISVTIIGCKPSNTRDLSVDNRKKIISYLKNHFKVIPQINLLDTSYINLGKRIGTESMIDSLISEHLSIVYYKPLNLNFIEFGNGNGYGVNELNTIDSLKKYCFSISLIQKVNTDTFYQDYINDEACKWSCLDFTVYQDFPNKLPYKFPKDYMGLKENIKEADIECYNSIELQDVYIGEEEIRKKYRGRGLELVLNNEFKYKKPTKAKLDGLFLFYDSIKNHNYPDSILNLPQDLFSYLTNRVKKIKTGNKYGQIENLHYLKNQIKWIMIKHVHNVQRENNGDSFLWVCYRGRRLFIRTLDIKGTSETGFSYFIDERMPAFSGNQ